MLENTPQNTDSPLFKEIIALLNKKTDRTTASRLISVLRGNLNPDLEQVIENGLRYDYDGTFLEKLISLLNDSEQEQKVRRELIDTLKKSSGTLPIEARSIGEDPSPDENLSEEEVEKLQNDVRFQIERVVSKYTETSAKYYRDLKKALSFKLDSEKMNQLESSFQKLITRINDAEVKQMLQEAYKALQENLNKNDTKVDSALGVIYDITATLYLHEEWSEFYSLFGELYDDKPRTYDLRGTLEEYFESIAHLIFILELYFINLRKAKVLPFNTFKSQYGDNMYRLFNAIGQEQFKVFVKPLLDSVTLPNGDPITRENFVQLFDEKDQLFNSRKQF